MLASVGDTLVTVAIIVVCALVFLLYLAAKIVKTREKLKHHDRCEACRKRLKYAAGSFASTCSHCGARQSWA